MQTKFKASTIIHDMLEDASLDVRTNLRIYAGWEFGEINSEKQTGKPQVRLADVLFRTIKIDEWYPDFANRKQGYGETITAFFGDEKSRGLSGNPYTTGVCAMGSDASIGSKSFFRPRVIENGQKLLPFTLEDIASIRSMRIDENSIGIGFDTEFVTIRDEAGLSQRLVLSYQFTLLDSGDPNLLHECVFVPATENRLPFSKILAWILRHYNLCKSVPLQARRRWKAHVREMRRGKVVVVEKVFDNPREAWEQSVDSEEYRDRLYQQFDHYENGMRIYGNAIRSCVAVQTENGTKTICDGSDGGYFNDDSAFLNEEIAQSITLICHFGDADISSFGWDDYEVDLLARCSKVQGGLVSLRDFYCKPRVLGYPWRFYPCRLCIRDTMCFAPEDHKSLKSIGETIGIQKIRLPYSAIENMDSFFRKDPILYMEYAINDAVICSTYCAEIWGVHRRMGITLSSGSARAAVPVMMDYFGVEDKAGFDLTYRGLVKEIKGLKERKNGGGLYQSSSLEPCSYDAWLLMDAASLAYHGGFNGCDGPWYEPRVTHDYDLKNAYPTSMCCVGDPDWADQNLILSVICGRDLDVQDFHGPYDLIFGDIEFEFPEHVRYPCIPVSEGGCVIFPRTSKGLNSCHASGPEIYLALRLGAKVFAKRVYVGRFRKVSDNAVSHSLLAVCHQLITDRNLAKERWGDGSLEEQLLKILMNSVYGKTAQCVVAKKSWSAVLDKMVDIGISDLTSPVHACLITAGVRAVLNAAINQLINLGYRVYSVTTDGMITDAPLEVLENLDLYDLTKPFRTARVALTGDPTMWSEKHTQDDLLNFTTRGNVSLCTADVITGRKPGVCAHNSFKSHYQDIETGCEGVFEPDSFTDRYILYSTVGTRNGRVNSPVKRFTGFKHMATTTLERQDFLADDQERNLRMDFDMKRKPVEETMEQVFFTIQGGSDVIEIRDEPLEVLFPEIPDVEWVNIETVPYEDIGEFRRYRKVYDRMECLRTYEEWRRFFALTRSVNDSCVRKISDLDWTILFSCVMGHRIGIWTIPFLAREDKTVSEKIEWINSFNCSKKKFGINDWKNARRQDRISQMLPEEECHDLLMKMMVDSEQILIC